MTVTIDDSDEQLLWFVQAKKKYGNSRKGFFPKKAEDISYKIQTSSFCSKQIFLPPFVRSLKVPFKSERVC